MTGYNTILDTEIDPDSPITTTLIARLRDNPIALAEGSPGAPKVQQAAISPGAITRSKLSNTMQRNQIVGACVEFNGLAPVSFVYSHNIIAITDHGNGIYELHYWVALTQAFNAMQVTFGGGVYVGGVFSVPDYPTTTSSVSLFCGRQQAIQPVEKVYFTAWSGWSNV